MSHLNLLYHLQKNYDGSELITILSGLRQDHLVWDFIGGTDFERYYLEDKDPNIEKWNPTNLGLVVLGVNNFIRAQEKEGTSYNIPRELIEKGTIYFQQAIERGISFSTLADAMYLALGMYEKMGANSNPRQLLAELINERGEGAVFNWGLPLACLAGLVKSPADFFLSLYERPMNPIVIRSIIHAILCQPYPLGRKTSLIQKVILTLEGDVQDRVIAWLKLTCHNELAVRVATGLIQTIQAENEANYEEHSQKAGSISLFQRLATLHHLQGDHDNAKEFYGKASLGLIAWQEELQKKMQMLYSPEQVSMETSDHQIVGSSEENDISQPEKKGSLNEVIEWSRFTNEPFKALLEDLSVGVSAEPFRYLNFDPAGYLQSFQDIDNLPALLSNTLVALKERPLDLDLMDLASSLLCRLDDCENALVYSLCALILDPDTTIRIRSIISISARLGEWQKVVDYSSTLDAKHELKSREDLLVFARSTFITGNLEKTRELCKRILNDFGEDSQALLLLGRVYLEEKEYDASAKSLAASIKIDSSSEETWSLLADVYETMGEPDKAIDTLSAAGRLLGGSSSIQEKLADKYLKRGSLEEASQCLERAVKASPDSKNSYETLIKINRDLGDTDKALSLVCEALTKWPGDPELEFLAGKTFSDTNREQEAFHHFEVAINHPEAKPEWGITYLRAIMGNTPIILRETPIAENLRTRARKLLDFHRDSLTEGGEGLLYHAELNAADGAIDAALHGYQEFIKREKPDKVTTFHRALTGYSQILMRAGEFETALILLREADEIKANDLHTNRSLAIACLNCGLTEEAKQVAQKTHLLVESPEENINWYGDFLLRLGNTQEAIDLFNDYSQRSGNKLEPKFKVMQILKDLGDIDQLKSEVTTLIESHRNNLEDLRTISHFLISSQEYDHAEACISRAMEVDAALPVDMLFDLSVIKFLRGEFQAAREIIRQAVRSNPLDIGLQTFMAEIHAALGERQEAVKILEEVAHSVQNGTGSFRGVAHGSLLNDNLFQRTWAESLIDIDKIWIRLIHLYMKTGCFELALQNNLELLKSSNNEALALNLLAELYHHTAQKEKALSIIDKINEKICRNEVDETDRSVLAGHCLEIAMNYGDYSHYPKLSEVIAEEEPVQSRRKLLKSRMDFLNGKWQEAREVILEVCKDIDGLPDQKKCWQALSWDPYCYADQDENWLIQALIEVGIWDKAYELNQKEIDQGNHAPIWLLNKIQILLGAEEDRRMRESLGCDLSTHFIPLPTEKQTAIQNTIESLKSWLPVDELAVWEARLSLLYDPSSITTDQIGRLKSIPVHLPAVIRYISEMGQEMEIDTPAGDNMQPVNSQVCMALGYLHKDLQKAVSVSQQLVEHYPLHPYSLMTRALCLFGEGKLDDAIDYAEKAIVICPDESGWRRWVAERYEEKFEFERAISHLFVAYDLDPQKPANGQLLSKMLIKTGRSDQAVAVLKTLLDFDQEDGITWKILATAQQNRNNLVEALASAEQAVQFLPNSDESWLLLGEIAMELGELTRAERCARMLMDNAKDSAKAAIFISRLLIRNGKGEEALAFLARFLRPNGGSIEIQLANASMQSEIRGLEAGRKAFEAIKEHNPENPEVLSGLAKIQFEMGDYTEAEKNAERSLANNPSQADLHLVLGIINRNNGQLDKALHNLTEATRLCPSSVESLLEMGKTHHQRREYLQALNFYNQVIKLEPGLKTPYIEGALAAREIKDYLGAESYLRKALKLDPDNVELHRQLSAMIALNLVHNFQEV